MQAVVAVVDKMMEHQQVVQAVVVKEEQLQTLLLELQILVAVVVAEQMVRNLVQTVDLA
jgi:hypothetical protein